jgi:hypothetical protein
MTNHKILSDAGLASKLWDRNRDLASENAELRKQQYDFEANASVIMCEKDRRIDELQARIARLESAIQDECEEVRRVCPDLKNRELPLEQVLNEQPRQSVAEIEVRVLDRVFTLITNRIDSTKQDGVSAYGGYDEDIHYGQRKFVDGMRSARLVVRGEAARIRADK